MIGCWTWQDMVAVFIVGCHMPMVIRALKEHFGLNGKGAV